MKAFILALSVGSILAASPFDNWTIVSPPGETNAFRTVTFGQGTFLAGAENGKLYSAVDGANWTSVSNPNTKDFAHLIFYRNRFFATTRFSGSGTALYDSPDGVNWTFRAQREGDFGAWDTVLFWKGKYWVAGRSRSFSSSDLVQWTITPSGSSIPETDQISETAVGNENVYIWNGVGMPNRAVTPTTVTTLNSLSLFPVVYLEPNFVASSLADSTVMRSTDGINWEPLGGNLPRTSVLNLIQANDTFVLDARNKIYTSMDFANWTEHDAPPAISRSAMASGNSVVVRVGENGLLYRSDPVGDSAPVFIEHPVSATVEAQKRFELNVTVSGSLPLSLQWRKNGGAINGANSLTFSIASADVSDSGDYDVVATNLFGSGTSHVANVLVDFFGIKNYAGLTVKGAIGQKYRIEYRQGLGGSTWTPLTEIVLSATNQVWIDYESPENSGRFYRSVFVP